MKSPVNPKSIADKAMCASSENLDKSPSINFNYKMYRMSTENGEHILGKILTVIDSSISDPEQRKAMKNLIQSAYYDNRPAVHDFGEITRSFCEQYCKEGVMGKGSERALLGIQMLEYAPEVLEYDFTKSLN